MGQLDRAGIRSGPFFFPLLSLISRAHNLQAFFTAILGRIGVKGVKIEEVLSVDEDTLATLPLVAPLGPTYEGRLS